MSREFLVIMSPQKDDDVDDLKSWYSDKPYWWRYTPGMRFFRRIRIFFKRSLKKWILQ